MVMRSPSLYSSAELSGSETTTDTIRGMSNEPKVPISGSTVEVEAAAEVLPTLRTRTASRSRTVVEPSSTGRSPTVVIVTSVVTGGT